MKNRIVFVGILLCFLAALPVTMVAQVDSIAQWIAGKQFIRVVKQADSLDRAGLLTPPLQLAVAQAYEGVLRYNDAYRWYKRCLDADSLNRDLLYATARLAGNMGKVRDAEGCYQKVLAQDSADFYANIQLALLYYQTEEYDKALGRYDVLQSVDSTNSVLWSRRGDCYMKKNEPLSAAVAYFQGFDLNREDAQTAHSLINALLRLGEDSAKDALAICDTALVYNPNTAFLLRDRATAYYVNKQFIKADSLFTQLFEEGDSSYLVVKYLGASRFRAGNFINAVDPLALAYDKDSAAVEVTALLGAALGKTYDRKEGLRLLNRADSLLLPDPSLLFQLSLYKADVLNKERRLREAAQIYYKLYKSNPDRVDLLLLMAKQFGVRDSEGRMSEDELQRYLFALTFLLRSGITEPAVQQTVRFYRSQLQKLYEDLFFLNKERHQMVAPDGTRSWVTMQELQQLLNSVPYE